MIPEIDEDADRRLSKRVLVKNRLEPSVRLVVDMFSEEVANPMKVLFGPPISRDDEAIDVKPVPPYTTPIDVVAVTNPLFACRGPFRVFKYKLPDIVWAVEDANASVSLPPIDAV